MNSNTFTIAFCRVDSFNPHAEISGIQKSNFFEGGANQLP
jgi:hypothetical protein